MRTAPYQPLLFRILHGLSALLVIGALISGFLVYDSWDGRMIRLGLTNSDRNLIDIHGTFGFFLFFVFIGFAIYSLSAGRKRLVQARSLQQLTEVGQPVWWVALQRIANTLMLFAAALAVVSGKFQDENWLPNGETNHIWYFVHIAAWAVVLISFLIHLSMSAKVGGIPLLTSMLNWKWRDEDRFVQQCQQLIARFRSPKS